MDVDGFYAQFPEFVAMGTGQTFVAAALAEASVRMGGPAVRIWGAFGAGGALTTADMAQGNLAADYLMGNPFGTETRLADDGKKSKYRLKFDELMYSVAGGVTVSGGPSPRRRPWL